MRNTLRWPLAAQAASLEPYVREKPEMLKEKHPSVGDLRVLSLALSMAYPLC